MFCHRRFLRVLVLSALSVGLVVLPPTRGAGEEDAPAYNLARMEAFSWVLLQLKDDYVNPSRIKPAAMMTAALEQVEQRAAEIEIKLRDGRATVQVGAARQDFEVGRPATVWEMNYNLQPVFAFIAEHMESTSDPKDVEFAAINGMLATLDPHSNLLPPELFREMQLKTTGEFGGLGIRITIRNGALTIISPLPDTPAARKGLRAMDQIVRIEDQSTENMPLDEAVNLLRGRPGSRVTIWVMRKGWSEPHKYVITRDTIRVRSVVSELLDNDIGYIKIQDFGRHTAGDFLRHLTELKRKGKGLDGLVLDLRDNAGGLMKAAVQVADLFLDRGIIVATVAYSEDSTPEQRVQKSREEQRAKRDGVERDLPLVVLVNSGSASASEILAGALKNLDRAVLMGEQTFGKGTVQILNERVPRSVEGACLKLTVAEYLIPGDVSIQEVGVTPDIQTVPVFLEKDNIQAFAQRERFREEDIPAHLKTRKAFELKPAATIRYLYEKQEDETDPEAEDEPPLDEPEFREDFEIRLAKQFLLDVHTAGGAAMLDQGQAFLKRVQAEQQDKIEKGMAALGLDWSAGAVQETSQGAAGEPAFALAGEGVDDQGRALADQKVTMRLTVQNEGTRPFFRLRAESECKNRLYDNREFLFGKVEPGTSRSWEVPVKIPRSAISRIDDLRFKFSCEGDTPPPPLNVTITTHELARPAFGFSWRVRDEGGVADGLIQPGERIELDLTVHNRGAGKAHRAKALLKNEAGKDLFLESGKGRVSFKEIPPGASRTKAFRFRVRDDCQREELPVELTIWDADLGTTQVAMLNLPVQTTSDEKPLAVRTGLEVRQARAPVRGGADVSSPLVGFAKKGFVLAADQRLGHWYRIQGKQGPAGWIHAESVRKVPARKGRPVAPGDLLTFVQVTPPRIRLDPVPGYVKDDRVQIEAVVEDEDSPLRDVAVWVGDDKVHLQPGAGADNPRRLRVDVPVKLDPGPNLISIMAREGARYAAQKTLVVTRPGGLDWERDDAQLVGDGKSSLILE